MSSVTRVVFEVHFRVRGPGVKRAVPAQASLTHTALLKKILRARGLGQIRYGLW